MHQLHHTITKMQLTQKLNLSNVPSVGAAPYSGAAI